MEQLTFDFSAPGKACSGCGIVKPLDAFGFRKSSKDGRQGRCRDCVKEYLARHYRENRQRVLEQTADYRRRNADRVREQRREYGRATAALKAEYDRAYRVANADRLREYRAAYYAVNADRLREQQGQHRRQNARLINERKRRQWAATAEAVNAQRRASRDETDREKARRWRAENAEAVRATRARRRLRVGRDMDAIDRLLSVEYRKAIADDLCTYCGRPGEQADHKLPLARGGTDHWWNLHRTCKSCNCRKRTMTHDEFLASGKVAPLRAAS